MTCVKNFMFKISTRHRSRAIVSLSTTTIGMHVGRGHELQTKHICKYKRTQNRNLLLKVRLEGKRDGVGVRTPPPQDIQ